MAWDGKGLGAAIVIYPMACSRRGYVAAYTSGFGTHVQGMAGVFSLHFSVCAHAAKFCFFEMLLVQKDNFWQSFGPGACCPCT